MFSQDRRSWQTALLGAVIGAGLMAWLYHSTGSVQAEVRRTTPAEPDQHFKSGGRLAEGVLQEILVVLKRIDERLERVETRIPAQALPTRTQPGDIHSVGETLSRDPDPSVTPQIKIRRSR